IADSGDEVAGRGGAERGGADVATAQQGGIASLPKSLVGEKLLVRGRRWPAARTGEIVRVAGILRPLGERDLRARLAHAHGVLWATRSVPTGRRRRGLVGVLDQTRERAEQALARGLAAPQAALARGMVLGQDEALDEPTRERFRASGLAHILAA